MMETIPYLTKEPDGFSYAMEPQDVLYGLGENVRGINKRGWVYESKCSDDGNHTEGKSSLYGAYNFMIVSGKDTFGFFIDYPGKTSPICSTRKPVPGLAVNIKFCWIRGSRASGMI